MPKSFPCMNALSKPTGFRWILNHSMCFTLHFLSETAQIQSWHDKSVCTSAKPSLSPLHLSPPFPVVTPPSPSISQSQTHLIWGVIAGADLWLGVERSDCCAPLSAEDEIEENSAQETPCCFSWLPRLIPSSKRTTVPMGSWGWLCQFKSLFASFLFSGSFTLDSLPRGTFLFYFYLSSYPSIYLSIHPSYRSCCRCIPKI